MDARYFLRNRISFIRTYYDTAGNAFGNIKVAIENGEPPYNDPPYSEDEEPAYMEEWMQADSAIKILGISCVSLLSDSLKLYFQALEQRVIGFRFSDRKAAFAKGFVSAYLGVLQSILQTNWSDCPANLEVVEQIVLARNRGQHGEHLSSFDVTHDGSTLEKYPSPYFVAPDERELFGEHRGASSTFLMPTLEVTRENLFSALDEASKLADYIEDRLPIAWEWRNRQVCE